MGHSNNGADFAKYIVENGIPIYILRTRLR